MTDLVTVKTFSSRMEAEIARGLLTSAKIPSTIITDDAGGMFPFPISNTFGVQLKVSARDMARSNKILNYSQPL
jgi:hypothetical protein